MLGVIEISPVKNSVPSKTKSTAGTKSIKKTAKTTKKTTKTKSSKIIKTSSKSGDKVLVIVESPSKAATLSNMLGKNYVVKSSKGHMKDLPKSRLAIDIENNFQPEYILVKGKATLKNELLKLAESSSHVLLASDPDREGEAIAWHLADLLGVDLSQ